MTFKWDVKLLFQSHFKHDLISTLPNIAGSNDSPGEQGMLGLISRLALSGWSSRSCRAEPLMTVRRTPALSYWRLALHPRKERKVWAFHNQTTQLTHVCLWKQKNVCSASHRTLQSKREIHLITYTHGKLNTSCFSNLSHSYTSWLTLGMMFQLKADALSCKTVCKECYLSKALELQEPKRTSAEKTELWRAGAHANWRNVKDWDICNSKPQPGKTFCTAAHQWATQLQTLI